MIDAREDSIRPWCTPYHSTEESKVVAIMDRYNASGAWDFPRPLIVDYGNDCLQLDGHHRMEAARRLEVPEIPVYMIDGADFDRLIEERYGGDMPWLHDLWDFVRLPDGRDYTDYNMSFSRKDRFQYDNPPETDTAFQRWFDGSKVVDLYGTPQMVYHGTTHDFDRFTLGRATVENAFGRGFYFSSSPEDVSANYAGIGPDLTNRIEALANQLFEESESESEYDDDAEPLTPEEAFEKATKELSGGKFAILPVYLSIKNPLVIGEPVGTEDNNSETYFDLQHAYDGYEGDVVAGGVAELMNQLREAAGGDDVEEANMEIYERVGEEGEAIPASELVSLLREHENLLYLTDYDTGQLNIGDVLRRAFEGLGFDGIIDHTVYQRFGPQALPYGGATKGMEGLHPDTTHYIAFAPEQIKSATGNRGTWDPNDPNITHNPASY